MPSFTTPNGDATVKPKAWTDRERTGASGLQPAKKLAPAKAAKLAGDWHSGPDSAVGRFSASGGKVTGESHYRQMKSELSDTLRNVVGHPNYTPGDAADVHALIGHVRAEGHARGFEGAKKSKTAGGYYGGCSTSSPSPAY